jgi:hypothetical protein
VLLEIPPTRSTLACAERVVYIAGRCGARDVLCLLRIASLCDLNGRFCGGLIVEQVKDIIILCRHARRPEGPALASQLTRHLDLFLRTIPATVFVPAMGADACAGTLLATVYALAMGADAFAGTLRAIKCVLAMGAEEFGITLRAIHFALAMGADAFAGTLLAIKCALAMGAEEFGITLRAIHFALAMGADPPGGGERRHHA